MRIRTTEYDLEEALTEASEAQRKEYFRLWGLTGEKYRNFEDYLGKVIESLEEPICARFVWEYLTADERQILYHSMSYSARDGLTRDALQKKAQLTPEHYNPAVDSLLQKLLLYEKKEEMDAGKRGHNSNLPRDRVPKGERKTVSVLYPFDDYLTTLYNIGREIFTPLGDRSKKTFTEIIANLDNDVLYDIYHSYALEWDTHYSRDAREMIAKTLFNLQEPLDALIEVEGNVRDLYVWLRQQGGRASMQEVRTHTGLNDSSLAPLLYQLESTALAFDTLTREGRVLFIPHDIFTRLQPIATNAADVVIELPAASVSGDFVPAAIRHTEMVLLYDMASVINAIYQQTIEPTQVGRVPKRISNKLRSQLHGLVRPDYQYDDNYLEMLLDIAKENALVQLSKSPLPDIKDHYEAGDRLSWWSQLDVSGQAAYLLHTWKSSFRWDDLQGVHYRAWDPYAWKPIAGREIILKHLSQLTPGRWFTVASLLQSIWDKDPFAMHPKSPYTRKTTGHSKSRETYEKWERADGETYIGMLASTLYELGIVDLGYDRPGALEAQQQLNPTAFMLTEFGAALLPLIGEDQARMNDITRTLIVQPSFELLILQPDMPTLYSLLPFTQVTQAGMVSRLMLNRTTLLRALEAGKNSEQILQILEARSQKELPQNVIYSLNDWAKSYKGARFSHVLLIEVTSEAVANQLNASAKLKGLGLRQLGPFIFALNSESNIKQLKQTFEQEGISVQISGNIFVARNRPSTIYDMHR